MIDFTEYAGSKVKIKTIDGVIHEVIIWGLDFEDETEEKVVGINTDKIKFRPEHILEIDFAE